MHNQTTAPSTFDSIASDLLLEVAGGCGKRGCCPCPQSVSTTVNAPVLLQMPQPAAPQQPATSVSTSVNIGGQPQA